MGIQFTDNWVGMQCVYASYSILWYVKAQHIPLLNHPGQVKLPVTQVDLAEKTFS